MSVAMQHTEINREIPDLHAICRTYKLSLYATSRPSITEGLKLIKVKTLLSSLVVDSHTDARIAVLQITELFGM